MWRFEAIDNFDVGIMMSRDTDTRILLREQKAVEQWVNSDKAFHIMRDHPWHSCKIQGGMFGVKNNIFNINWIANIENIKQTSTRDYDQSFLSELIYPVIKNNCMFHTSFHKYEGINCINFPINFEDDDYKFVGEYVYEDESRNQQNTEELRRGYL